MTAERDRHPKEATGDDDTVSGAQALGRGVSVLLAIGEAERPPRFTDLLAVTGMPKGTLHRLLGALIEHRLVRRDRRDRTYRLGMRLFELGSRVWDDFDLLSAATPELERLCQAHGETTRLSVLDGTDVVIMDQRLPREPVALRFGVGSRVPAHLGAAGRAIVAALPAPEQDQLFARLHRRYPAGEARLVERRLKTGMSVTRALGYAFGEEGDEPDLRSVAAPILDDDGYPIGAIVVACAIARVEPDRLHQIGREVVKACGRASGNRKPELNAVAIPPRPGPVSASTATCLVRSNDFVGESPIWDDRKGRLLWVDVLAPALNMLDWASGRHDRVPLAEISGSIVLTETDGLLAGGESGFCRLDEATGTLHCIVDPEPDTRSSRFNVGKVDPAGRFWAASYTPSTTPQPGSLYVLDETLGVRLAKDGLAAAKGLAWSPCGRILYYADSHERTVRAFAFDPATGDLGEGRILVRHEGDGAPNGLAADAEGFLWVAIYGGWRVDRYDPEGRLERSLWLPSPLPLNCAFGGPGLDRLFVTTARIRIPQHRLVEAPLSGGLFAWPAPVRGLPAARFAEAGRA